MISTEVIRNLCAKKEITIAKLEKELGLGNGTLASSKSSYMRSDRLKAIADYFHVSMEYLMTGEERPEDSRESSLSPEDRILIEAYHRADEGIQESVCKLLDIKKRDYKEKDA